MLLRVTPLRVLAVGMKVLNSVGLTVLIDGVTDGVMERPVELVLVPDFILLR